MSGQPNTPFNSEESLSVLMDGAAHELELQRLLQECANTPDLRKRWVRYQLISAAMHKQSLVASQSLRFADAVSAAIDGSEESLIASRHSSGIGMQDAHGGWGRVVSRIAVAASVAFVMVLGAQWQQQHAPGSEGQQLAASDKETVKQPMYVAQPSVPLPVSVVAVSAPLVGGIFDQPRDKRDAYSVRQAGFENAARGANASDVPLIRASERAVLKK